MPTGQQLRTLRTSAGLTQGEIASMVGMPISTICEIETGKRPLGAMEAARIMATIGDLKRDREATYQAALETMEAASSGQGVAK